MKFAFIQNKFNENEWYACTDFTRKDFGARYSMGGNIILSSDSSVDERSNLLFESDRWIYWEYGTQEEMIAKHLEHFL